MVVLGQDRNDHGGILRALALVDGGGVGGNQRVKLAEAVGHRAPVEARHEFARLGIDVDDITDVAVVDFLVVVILDLHDLVAGRKGPAETLDLAFAGGVQRRLQFDVERTRADAAAVHRTEHLDVADRVQAETLGDAGLHQFQDALNGGLGIFGRHKVEVAVAGTKRRPCLGSRSAAACNSLMTPLLRPSATRRCGSTEPVHVGRNAHWICPYLVQQTVWSQSFFKRKSILANWASSFLDFRPAPLARRWSASPSAIRLIVKRGG